MKKIATLTLNPAVDRYYYLDEIKSISVNRALQTNLYPGGKGINVALALDQIGIKSTIFGCIGGNNGRIIRESLQERDLENWLFEIAAETRENLKLVELSKGKITEINTPGPLLSEREFSDLAAQLSVKLSEFSFVVLSGSLPPGIPSNFYAELITKLKENQTKVFFDADAERLRLGIAAKPFLIKPNRNELEGYLGRTDLSREDLRRAAERLLGQGTDYVVISDGAAGAVFVGAKEAWWAEGKRIEAASTVGCGDALLAGVVAGFVQELPLREIAKFGLAVANAKAMLNGTVFPEMSMITEIMELIKVTSM